MDNEFKVRLSEMFKKHYKDGIITGIGYSAVFIFLILLIGTMIIG